MLSFPFVPQFARRHIGPDSADAQAMLKTVRQGMGVMPPKVRQAWGETAISADTFWGDSCADAGGARWSRGNGGRTQSVAGPVARVALLAVPFPSCSVLMHK